MYTYIYVIGMYLFSNEDVIKLRCRVMVYLEAKVVD